MEVILSDYERERSKLRFMQYIVTDDATGCWNWTARRYVNGYGQFWLGKIMKASRASHMIFIGPIPEGLHVLHKCHNSACVNPDHLYAGDHQQNMRDRDEAGHTSRGEHRYNFKRNPDLVEKAMVEFRTGKQAHDVCAALGIGWSTLYRLRAQSPELKQLMADTKSARYTKGQKKSWEARSG